MIERYRLSGEKADAIDRQRAIEPTSLDDTAAALHSAIERAIIAENWSLVDRLAGTVAKLSHEIELQRERQGRYIDRSKLDAVARAFFQHVCATCEPLCKNDDEYYDFCNRLLGGGRVAAIIDSVVTPKTQLLLTDERGGND